MKLNIWRLANFWKLIEQPWRYFSPRTVLGIDANLRLHLTYVTRLLTNEAQEDHLAELLESPEITTTQIYFLKSMTSSFGILGPYTVFAPTNAAFNTLPDSTILRFHSDNEYLTNVLSYHICEGRYSSRNFTNEMIIKTLTHEPLRINQYTDGWQTVSYLLGPKML